MLSMASLYSAQDMLNRFDDEFAYINSVCVLMSVVFNLSMKCTRWAPQRKGALRPHYYHHYYTASFMFSTSPAK